jgi:hypothetical protein
MSHRPHKPPPADPEHPLHGKDLASLRPVYIDVSTHAHADAHAGPHHHSSQYVIAKTLLGDPVLCWIEPWLAGLFCMVLIADYLPESMWRETALMWRQSPALPPAGPKVGE